VPHDIPDQLVEVPKGMFRGCSSVEYYGVWSAVTKLVHPPVFTVENQEAITWETIQALTIYRPVGPTNTCPPHVRHLSNFLVL